MIPFWKPGFFTVGLHLHWVKFLDFFFFFYRCHYYYACGYEDITKTLNMPEYIQIGNAYFVPRENYLQASGWAPIA